MDKKKLDQENFVKNGPLWSLTLKLGRFFPIQNLTFSNVQMEYFTSAAKQTVYCNSKLSGACVVKRIKSVNSIVSGSWLLSGHLILVDLKCNRFL
jgi:hypothetical protein